MGTCSKFGVLLKNDQPLQIFFPYNCTYCTLLALPYVHFDKHYPELLVEWLLKRQNLPLFIVLDIRLSPYQSKSQNKVHPPILYQNTSGPNVPKTLVASNFLVNFICNLPIEADILELISVYDHTDLRRNIAFPVVRKEAMWVVFLPGATQASKTHPLPCKSKAGAID